MPNGRSAPHSITGQLGKFDEEYGMTNFANSQASHGPFDDNVSDRSTLPLRDGPAIIRANDIENTR